ncbi:MAG TPA: hypothetical protein VGU45_02050 [Microvirga sp.]|jgi:hypothetical protein|nr:hypothetical protein [Microvirga sp.]
MTSRRYRKSEICRVFAVRMTTITTQDGTMITTARPVDRRQHELPFAASSRGGNEAVRASARSPHRLNSLCRENHSQQLGGSSHAGTDKRKNDLP